MSDERVKEIVTIGPEETISLGGRLGSLINPPFNIALIGNLGTGKTHLIKGIISGLGADESENVSSPTFVIINEHHRPDGRICVYHIDAYRIESVEEFEMLGFDDYCTPESVILIEWADKIMPALTATDLKPIRMEYAGQTERKIFLENFPASVTSSL